MVALLKFTSLGYYSEGLDNNYKLIRFLMASLVLFSHCYPLTRGYESADAFNTILGFNSFGGIAVDVFMIVSGFLITRSLLNRPSLLSFLEARVLRIFPALIVANIFAVFFVGVMVTRLSVHDYFSHSSWREYLFYNSLLLDNSGRLAGVFESNPYAGPVNGSLWTLPTEFRLYIVFAALGLFGIHRKKPLFNALAIISYVLLWYKADMFPEISRLFIIEFTGYFLVGAIFYLNRDKIPVNTFIALSVAGLLILSRNTFLFNSILPVGMAYLVFWLAYSPFFQPLKGFNRIGDYSYGIYIYAYPVQQSIAAFYSGITPVKMLLLAYPIVFLLAFLSWRLIEQRALEYKGTLKRTLSGILPAFFS